MLIESSLPLLTVLIPFLGALAVFFTAKVSESLRNWVAIITSGITFVLALVLFLQVRDAVVVYELPWFLGFGLTWRVDFIGGLFALIVSLVWLLATVYAWEYMSHEHSRTRFFVFFIFTLGACAGVFLAGDLFSLFLFFELMTFSAYVLVIHEEDKASLQAGNVYLYMSVLGGLSLLAAVFLIQHLAGTTQFEPLLDVLVSRGVNPWIILIFVMVGFGVKAGMLPLHIWLPRAHPVAPSPASALLSALMIKAGAYGFVRFLLTILTPIDPELWIYPQQFGYLFLWIGAATMFIGAIMGVLNRSMKKILAYSSISQMGYILFSLGVGAFLGTRGAFGFAGAWMHMINHAFFKSFLFLLAGAVFIQTHELDLDKLGGFRKKMPWAFGFMLIAAASITGVPGLNGYVSKVLIHEAILEAYHLEHWPSLLWLERIFVVTGGLTVAYITKLWVSVFGGQLPKKWEHLKDISLTHKGVFLVYTVIVLGIGLFAQGQVDRLVIPATEGFNFYYYDVDHLGEVPFWHGKELAGPALAYVIGLLVLLFSTKFGHLIKIPRYFSVEYLLYRPIVSGGQGLIIWLSQLSAPRIDTTEIRDLMDRGLSLPKIRLKPRPKLEFKLKPRHRELLQSQREKEKAFIEKVRKTRGLQRSEPDDIEDAYWNTRNLSFDSLILALVIALSLLIFISIGL